eukprot:scaffold3248_cov112-Cylindrotheca_fusiformis.AAC.3
MASEEPKETPAAAEAPEAPAPTPAAAPAPAAAPEKKKNGKKGKRDERPIEELFDLSKPIPWVEKPDRNKYDKKLAELDAKFEKLRDEKRIAQQKIEGLSRGGKSSEVTKLRDIKKETKTKRDKLINEKKAIRAQLQELKAASDKLSKERKDTRSTVKFGEVTQIDSEINKLKKRQETTSMSLTEEKKLIREMDALKASKDRVMDLKSKDLDFDTIKAKRNAIHIELKVKDKQIDAVSKEMDDVSARIKEISERKNVEKSAVDGLFKDRDRLNDEIKAVLQEKDALRDSFRKTNDEFHNYMRAVKAKKKIEYEAEKKKRDEEHKEYLKKMEEEELKKPPYEAEQALCDYLAEYLERTYLKGGESTKAGEEETTKKGDVVAVTDDPFAGMKPANKKGEEEEFFSKGKGKKKRQRQPKKQAGAGPFTLNVSAFEQFGLIGLVPPKKFDEVENSVKELKERKEWYKNQPRGSVPTAKDIRKQNEAAAAKLRQGSSLKEAPKPAKGKFSLSDDEFVPLGKGASAAAADSSTWGQKPAAPAATTEKES